MSGQARRVPLLPGEGGWDQFWLQCHQPLIGAPSPVQANQPWYPTLIFPTTSPGGLAARAVRATPVSTAAAEPAMAVLISARRVTRTVHSSLAKAERRDVVPLPVGGPCGHPASDGSR